MKSLLRLTPKTHTHTHTHTQFMLNRENTRLYLEQIMSREWQHGCDTTMVLLWLKAPVCKMVKLLLWVSQLIRYWRFQMVADPTYNPKASVSDELGNPKQQFYHLTNRSFKSNIVLVSWQNPSLQMQFKKKTCICHPPGIILLTFITRSR